MSAICDLSKRDRRIRRKCPKHGKLEYAMFRECYDTCYIFFDCGVTIYRGDEGEALWEDGPKRKKQEPKR